MASLAPYRQRLTLALAALPVIGLFTYAVLTTGPLAPIPVTVTHVERKALAPSLFGIGLVEARYTHKIGPTIAGRLSLVAVQPGDRVAEGQMLAEIDPIDLDDRIGAQDAAVRRADAGVLASEAQIQEVGARKIYAETQAARYEQLFHTRAASEALVEAKRQDLAIAQASALAAKANRNASLRDIDRLRAERDGLIRQRANLRLVSPIDGLIARRDADAGTTVVAGQSVIEVVEPKSLWINARFDQHRALGLRAGLPAQIVLRSQGGGALAGRIARIEPYADAVTEEFLAKIELVLAPDPAPPIGELAEVTVTLAAQPSAPLVPNASIHRVDGHIGVWLVEGGGLRFVAVRLGVSDLAGQVQILEGLSGGETLVVYSQKALSAGKRITITDHVVGNPS